MSEPSTPGRPPERDTTRHWLRIAVAWVVLSVVGDVLWIKLVGPHIPPGRMSTTASGASFDFNVLIVIALPVMIGVWVYLVYAISQWRASKAGEDPVAVPAYRDHPRIEAIWISVTTVIVLFLAGFGIFELTSPEGAGGGEGPSPVWTPSSHNVLAVQVIGQQWKWTYRYPSFGGFESDELVVPINTAIAFHVTSLDVVHDFWAYQLGVKADADPSSDNVAFTTPLQLGTFIVRCDELCGLWHGAMYNSGTVVSKTAFEQWATTTEAELASNTKYLPPFAWTYVPDANGADGGYYPDTVDPYSPVETYGAPTPANG
jgi:cytochrome c oxidase subunit II